MNDNARRPWAAPEIQYLIQKYYTQTFAAMAEDLNRSEMSVATKAARLRQEGLLAIKEPRWSESELQFLEDNWGLMRVPVLARKLNRTLAAVTEKAERFGLGPSRNGSGRITAGQLSKALGIHIRRVIDYWIPKCGLKACRKVTRTSRKLWQIEIDDFWRWARDNQDKFDSRRFEVLNLGAEPPWMAEKRRRDVGMPKRRNQEWTPEEDARLKELYRAGAIGSGVAGTGRWMDYSEIGKRLGRSRTAVQHRLDRLRREERG